MNNTIEESLRAEIAFWQSLKNDWEEAKNVPVHSRIGDALALAEYKLRQYEIAKTKTKLH